MHHIQIPRHPLLFVSCIQVPVISIFNCVVYTTYRFRDTPFFYVPHIHHIQTPVTPGFICLIYTNRCIYLRLMQITWPLSPAGWQTSPTVSFIVRTSEYKRSSIYPQYYRRRRKHDVKRSALPCHLLPCKQALSKICSEAVKMEPAGKGQLSFMDVSAHS